MSQCSKIFDHVLEMLVQAIVLIMLVVLISDFNTHRDLLDCHFKTLAIVTCFIRQASHSDSQTQQQVSSSTTAPAVFSTSANELSNCLYEILKISPYQLGFSPRSRPILCVGRPLVEPIEGMKPLLDSFVDP